MILTLRAADLEDRELLAEVVECDRLDLGTAGKPMELLSKLATSGD